MINFFNSRKGNLTFSYNENLVHSAYDPLKEAEKYLKMNNLSQFQPLFLIINPGLNYIYDLLIKKHPFSRFIIIHASKEIYLKSAFKYQNNTSVWYPGKNIDLYSFLKSEIIEIEMKGIQILNWQPAADAFKDESDHINNTVTQIFREYNGNINTTNYFGKRYFKNIINNAESLESTISYSKISKPVLITSSGPSLEKSIQLINKYRNHFFLLAVSSSLSYLLENDIEPDLVITTDPGFYSTYHLKKITNGRFPIAAPLTAYHFRKFHKPFVILNQNSNQENIFFNNYPGNYYTIPQNGTVSGSALHLAMKLTDFPVFFTGLDFCTSDIKSHCIPGEFTIPDLAESTKNNSYLNILYNKYSNSYSLNTNKINSNKTSLQLKTYSDWFNSVNLDRNIYRINSTEMEINNFQNISTKEADNIIKDFKTNKSIIKHNYSTDRNEIVNSLSRSLNNIISNLKKKSKICLSSEYFAHFDKDILYNFSASVYLDTYSDFISGNKKTASKKYINLTDECISFLESLKVKLYE